LTNQYYGLYFGGSIQFCIFCIETEVLCSCSSFKIFTSVIHIKVRLVEIAALSRVMEWGISFFVDLQRLKDLLIET